MIEMGKDEAQPVDAVADQIRLLETCSDPSERNRMALELAESGDDRVCDALLRMIQRPELENHRGTLVCALSGFVLSRHLHLLVQLIAAGNFEVAHEAIMRLEEIEGRVDDT